jgi:hypothetical protein
VARGDGDLGLASGGLVQDLRELRLVEGLPLRLVQIAPDKDVVSGTWIRDGEMSTRVPECMSRKECDIVSNSYGPIGVLMIQDLFLTLAPSPFSIPSLVQSRKSILPSVSLSARERCDNPSWGGYGW